MMRRLLTISRGIIVTETPTICSPSLSNSILARYTTSTRLLSLLNSSVLTLLTAFVFTATTMSINDLNECEFMTQEELMTFLGEHGITLTEMRQHFRSAGFFEPRKEKRLDGENDAAFRFRLVVDKIKYSINFIKFFCSICKFRESHYIFSWFQFIREVWPECKKSKMVGAKFDRRFEEFTKVPFFQEFLRKCPLLNDESVAPSGQSTEQTYYDLESFQDSC